MIRIEELTKTATIKSVTQSSAIEYFRQDLIAESDGRYSLIPWGFEVVIISL